ncbi:uncharacterized protein F4822DRAFT_1635 [Hypoxylon trugodes]|uniref:uncharacterized protein n=1 Tax=Hypoxylon trugodes TaxID=326681 RepID=UPI002195EFA0|nr:uncharacterized protein F4822DRAFT_1635 [Hypoxylon trugodes]KAI1393152.1 hypothetical protein F4822DRAFT_1635 [Hypoxylon trugodes]
MNYFKRRLSHKPRTAAARKPDSRFENVDLLKLLMDKTERKISGRFSVSPERHPSPRSSSDRNPSEAYGYSTTSSTSSMGSDHGNTFESSLSTLATAASLHQAPMCPGITVPGNMSPGFPRGSFDNTQDSNFHKPYVELVVERRAGLKALFQEPVRLRPHSTSLSGDSVRLDAFPNYPYSPNSAPENSLSTLPSVRNSRPQNSECGRHDRPASTEFQAPQANTPNVRALTVSAQVKLDAETASRTSSETDRDMQAMDPRAQKVALSLIFMYQARMRGEPVRNEADSEEW